MNGTPTIVIHQPGSGTAPAPSRRPALVRADTYAAVLHHLLDLPIGIAGFVWVVTGISLGIGLIPLALVGLVVLVVVLLVARGWAAVERARAHALLGLAVTGPAPMARRAGILGWFGSRLGDVDAWRAVAYLVVLFAWGIAAFTITVTVWASALGGVTTVAWAWAIPGEDDVPMFGIPGAPTGPVRTLVYTVIGVLFLLAAPYVTRGLAAVDRGLVRGLLGARAGQRTAELERTRRIAVDNATADLRRIERTLHDGVQAQLVGVAIDLGDARDRLEGADDPLAPTDPRAVEALARAQRGLADTLADLRELTRGFQPAILADRGLPDALATLVSRGAVPTSLDLRGDLTQPRIPAALETIAYYTVAEGLTNVARHAAATRAWVRVERTTDRLVITIGDDGRGGAHVLAGTGLAALADRAATVDGRLRVASPVGGPTLLTLELPCAS